MLHELHISGLGVIDDVDLQPHEGLTVLTGETGAGKTMVTLAVALAVGARAGAHLVREGAARCHVQARFDAPPDADDEWAEDGQVILARTVGSDGRSGARIGGQMTTAATLAQLGERLVEIHGQHHSLRLLQPAVQTALIDRFAGGRHAGRVDEMGAAFRAWHDARGRLAISEGDQRDRERQIDLLRYQVDEIRAAAPAPGESEVLAAEISRADHAERLLELTAQADAALTRDGGAADALAEAAQALRQVSDLDPAATEPSVRLAGLAAEAAELARDVRAYAASVSVDPGRAATLRERLALLRSLQRRYGADDAEVIAFGRGAAERLAELMGADDRAAELASETERLREEYLDLAAQVRKGRVDALPDLARALTGQVRELGMPGAVVDGSIEPIEPSAGGTEHVTLTLSPGRGQPAAPLTRAVSGGELSRVMLACRSVLADIDQIPTLVFDEIDAGVGGQAGLAVGARLATLAASRQVIVVTHLPQLACFADRHVRVRKDRGVASIQVLDDDQRRVELSRMLAGLEGSQHGASHADELLAVAAGLREGAAGHR